MINTTRFKKILHILKQNANDLNINICIVDYDVAQECDYEEITLYLKETNTQNGAVVYKNFVIRSQLYYDVENDKYMSALDGDIFVKDYAPTKIDILTDITEESLTNVNNQIKIKLVDSETNEPLKNQEISTGNINVNFPLKDIYNEIRRLNLVFSCGTGGIVDLSSLDLRNIDLELYDFTDKHMANAILNFCIRQCRGHIRDDMTVLVIGVWKKEESDS